MKNSKIFCYFCIYCLCPSTSLYTSEKMPPLDLDMSKSFGSSNMLFLELIYGTLNFGEIVLRDLNEKINKQLEIFNNTALLEDCINEYFRYMNESAEFVSNQIVDGDLDREVYTLYVTDISNKLLHNQAKVLLQQTLSTLEDTNKTTLNNDADILSDYIEIATCRAKKDGYLFICEKFQVCRRFPEYSDHVAKILNEITLLPDTKFHIAARKVLESVVFKRNFFEIIMNYGTAKLLGFYVNSLQNNITMMRKRFITLKNMIQNKNWIFRYKNGKIPVRRRALGIVVDFFNAMFEEINEDSIDGEVDQVIMALKSWSKGDNINIGKVLTDHINYLKKVATHALKGKVTQNEVKCLIEVVVTGSSHYDICEDLIIKGSVYVRDDREKIWQMTYRNKF